MIFSLLFGLGDSGMGFPLLSTTFSVDVKEYPALSTQEEKLGSCF
jgi:hypothetical protein